MKAACAFDKVVPDRDRMKNDVPGPSSKIAAEVDNEFVTRDNLMKYFGKTKNGGGDIKSLIYPYEYKGRKVAVMEFEDRKCVESLLKKQIVFTVKRNKDVAVKIIEFDELMTSGSIDLNCSLYEVMKSTFPDDIDDIIEECDVEIDENTYVMKGEWYKLAHAKKKFDALVLNQSKTTLQDVKETVEQDNSPRAAEMSLQVDRHLLEYIQMTASADELEIIRDCDIMEKEPGDIVTLSFLETSNFEMMKRKRKAIEDMLHNASKNSVKEVFKPVVYNDDKINLGIKMVHTVFPGTVYASKTKDGLIVFVGPTKDQCDCAMSTFQSALFNEPTMGSYRVDKNDNNYTELDRYDFCNNELILRVLQGNIVDQNATAIVNAANKNLYNGSGVTGAIYDAGGQEFQRRCDEAMRQRGFRPLDIGEVLATEACGKLICQSVLHATAPKYYECDDKADCQRKMKLTCYRIFAMADSMQFKSISIPAMGTGIYGVPISVFCKALMMSIEEICDGISNGKFKYLREIRLVNYDKYEARQIASHLSHELEQSAITLLACDDSTA